MTATRPLVRPRKLAWSSLLAAAIVAASFLVMAVGKAVIIIAFAGLACVIGYAVVLGNYRQEKWPGLAALVIGIATLFPANIGGHSLWLTAFGETLHCKVISVESHLNRRSPTTYSNKLQCGGRQLDYHPTMYRSVKNPGLEMDVVVDRTGLVPNLEPGKVGLGHNLLFLLAVGMNAGLILLVARLPIRRPESAK